MHLNLFSGVNRIEIIFGKSEFTSYDGKLEKKTENSQLNQKN